MTINDSLNIKSSDSIYIVQSSNQWKEDLTELKVSSIKDLTDRVSSLEKKNNELSYSDYISGFSLLLSLFTSICLASYFFYNKFKQEQIKKCKYLSGEWTSEGDLAFPQPKPYLNFELDVDEDDGEIIGILNTHNNNYPEVLSINGKLKNNKAKVKITHFSQQRLLSYGEAELKLNGKIINWNLIYGEKDLFPKSSIVWKI